MIHWNGPLNPLPNLCRQQLWHCISSQTLHHPPYTLGPLHTVFFPLLLPSCMLSVSMGAPAPSCCTRMPAQPCQGCGSWGSRTRHRGGERSTTAVSHDPGHWQHFAKPLPPPCSEEAMWTPCPGIGGSTSVAAGGEAMGFFGLKPPAVTGRLTGAELTAGPAKSGPPKLRCFRGTAKGVLE